MSTSSLHQKINDLEKRLMLENNARDHDRNRHLVAGNELLYPRQGKAESGHSSPRKPRPTFGHGEFGSAASRSSSAPSPGGRRTRPQMMSMEIKHAPKQVHSLGELGHGTCGQVIKMRHKQTGHLMAVKQMRRSGNKEENKRIIMDLDRSMDLYGINVNMFRQVIEKNKNAYSRKNIRKNGSGNVKPSNILLDQNGMVKLCDFGISGRLVDSKAKTRSAGCAAYMAPERIDPPDPQRPDYDIRADVWSLDFEVLTKVLQEDPPLLPPGAEFSHEFCSFVRDCLTKDYKKRPKYKKLLEHPFIKIFEATEIDVAAWFKRTMAYYSKYCLIIQSHDTAVTTEQMKVDFTHFCFRHVFKETFYKQCWALFKSIFIFAIYHMMERQHFYLT
ncbi:hypothetical protein KUTeg_014587 [Tegillarca granosa]|uniref:Protein kinase domain-containing protein n=1 Tax=Tegillarca granosa TaxID=220873 RepID=A0ABQ9ERL6_TEGGR|nr:hypothetical protein KUTeg_014587 [Tegillarca granosa]